MRSGDGVLLSVYATLRRRIKNSHHLISSFSVERRINMCYISLITFCICSASNAQCDKAIVEQLREDDIEDEASSRLQRKIHSVGQYRLSSYFHT
jgi:hypothetical protein